MEASPHIRRLNNSLHPKYPELEVVLDQWVKELRQNLKVVTRSMIQIKAKALAQTERFYIMYSDIKECKFSSKWIDGFMVRHKFSHRRHTTVAQRLPEDLLEKQHEFLGFVLYRRIQYNYPLRLIGNMDETPVSFDLPSQTTIEETGSKTVSIRTCGYEKSNFTVILACMADGMKLPATIIFKLAKVPRQDFPSGIIIRANREGYSNTEEMLFWVENIWNQRASLSSNPRSLLVLDSFTGHLVNSVKTRFQEKNTNIAVIPGGLTCKLQPLDVSVNKSFKSKVSFKKIFIFIY